MCGRHIGSNGKAATRKQKFHSVHAKYEHVICIHLDMRTTHYKLACQLKIKFTR